jgi:hypothetical protein
MMESIKSRSIKWAVLRDNYNAVTRDSVCTVWGSRYDVLPDLNGKDKEGECHKNRGIPDGEEEMLVIHACHSRTVLQMLFSNWNYYVNCITVCVVQSFYEDLSEVISAVLDAVLPSTSKCWYAQCKQSPCTGECL